MRTAILLLLSCTRAAAADVPWKPAGGRIMTRWAKQVSPGNALPEYPRPQMTRER